MNKNHLVPLVYNKVFIQCFYNHDGVKRLEYLVSDCLGIEHERVKGHIKLLPRDLENDSNMSALTQVDFLLELDGKTINIEVNRTDVPYIFDRNLVYVGKIIGTKYKKGEDYQSIDAVIQININNFNTNKDKVIEKYMLYREDDKEIFSNNLKIYNIDITKAIEKGYKVKETEERIINWCKLFIEVNSCKFKQICDKIIPEEMGKEFVKVMEELSNKDEIIRLEGETPEVVLNTMKHYALEQGFEQGMQQGMQQGIEQGIEQGANNKSVEIVKNMLAKNMDIETISEITNLSKEEINKIKEN